MKPFNVFAALAARHSGPEWAYFPELRNGVGFARGPRTADALAMSLWPSRGLVLHGFEIKCSRADWLREKKDPEKAEDSLFAYCDYWWIVINDPKLVQPGELPPTWGLLVPRASRLVISVEAPRLSPAFLTRLVVASLLKRAKDYGLSNEVVRAMIDKARKEGSELGREAARREASGLRQTLEDLQTAVRVFEEASGVRLGRYEATKIGRRLRALLDQKCLREEAGVIARRLRDAHHEVKELVALDLEYKSLLEECGNSTADAVAMCDVESAQGS